MALGIAGIACGCQSFANGFASGWSQSAEDNRLVTVTIVGAVINVTNLEGRGWDDLPGTVVSADDVSRFAGLVAEYYVSTQTDSDQLADKASQFAEKLTALALAKWDKPDPTGTVEVYGSSGLQLSFPLATQQDTYTPRWNQQVPNVSIHHGSVIVYLRDDDFGHQENIGTISLSSADLLAIEAQRGPYVMDVEQATMGRALRFIVSVKPN